MNKNLVILVIVIVLVLAGYYLWGNSADNTAVDGQGAAVAGAKLGEATFTGSIADLAARGGDYQCAVSAEGELAGTKGTVFVSGNRVRGSFSSATPEGEIASNLIQDNGSVYVWSDSFPQGFKMAVTEPGTPTNLPNAAGTGFDANTAYSWQCDPWAVESTAFALPEGVTFMDPSTLPGVVPVVK